MIIRVPIEVAQTGSGVKGVVGDLEQVERKARSANDATKGFGSGLVSTSQQAGALADSMGRMSTTLARSADTLGLNAAAFRSLDDVMDVAELGFKNLTKSAVGFNAASIGVAGAGFAIGNAIGTWLNTFPAVQKTADALFHSMFRFVGLAGQVGAPVKGLATTHEEAKKRVADSQRMQVAALKATGMPLAEIAKQYRDMTPELQKELGLTHEAVKTEEKKLELIKKQAEERQKFAAIVKAGISDRMIEEMAGLVTQADLLKAAPGAKKGGTAAALVNQFTGSRLEGETVSGILKEQTQAAEKLAKDQADATKLANDRTQNLIGTFGTLSNQLTNLSQTVGGVAGKILKTMASLSSGAGGIMSGLKGWKDSAGGGLQGFLGKFSAGLGMVGSAIGVVGGVIGGLKSLFGGKSKEQKAAEAAARKQAEDDRKAALEEQKRTKIEGLKSAQSAAESLMGRMAEGGFSEKLTGALGTLIGRVQDALLKSGLGFMATGPLRESKAFGAAQGAAGDVAQLIAGMRQAGMIDQGLLGAAGASAEELRAQAVAAAEAAGLAPAEATKAGFGAIAPLLREQLNAAMASGQELDANTKALIEEAKKNGVTILADPMVESVAVQKDMLKELRGINGRGGGGGGVPGEGFASGTRGLRLVKSDMLAQIHEGEGLLVIPRDEMGRHAFRSFARGSDVDDPRIFDRGGAAGGGGTTSTSGTTTTTTSSTTSSTASDLEATVERVVSRIQPVSVTNAPTVQIVDNSIVRTVEGQKRFERETVQAVERALDQNARGLESRIERIARRAVG